MHGTIGLHGQYALVPPQAFAARMEQHWVKTLTLSSSPALLQQWVVTATTFLQAITDTVEKSEALWRVLQPPTGSGKTQGAVMYAAMQAELNAVSGHKPVGILIVTRLIAEANKIAEEINSQARREAAVAHHSATPATPEAINSADVLVVTHQAYVNAAESLSNHRPDRWELFTRWRGGRRLLTIIDEALDSIVEHYKITADTLSMVIGYIPLDIRLEHLEEVHALEVLLDLLKACAEAPTVDQHRSQLVWDYATTQPPERINLNPLWEAMKPLQYDLLIDGEENSERRLKIAKRVKEVLQEAQILTDQWAYYTQRGAEHSINSSALLVPPWLPGPVVLDATASSNLLWDLLEDKACIIPTPHNVRDYANVKLHVARATGLGKHAMIRRAASRVPRVLTALEREIGSERDVLMVMHKAVQHVPETFEHHFINLQIGHWGAIDGRNDWADCDTAVILGIPYRDHIWSTNTFCALQGPQDDEWMQEPSWGEHKDVLRLMEQKQLSLSIIQAINRIRCRRVIDAQGRSLTADIFIILPEGKEGDAILRDIHADMPGLCEAPWNFELDGPKVRRPRKGSSRDALVTLMSNRLPGQYPLPALRRELGLTLRQLDRLKEDLRDNRSPITQTLLSMGVRYVVEGTGRGAKTFLIKHPPPYPL